MALCRKAALTSISTPARNSTAVPGESWIRPLWSFGKRGNSEAALKIYLYYSWVLFNPFTIRGSLETMDFVQNGHITTFHDYGRDYEWLKEELGNSNLTTSVIIPMLYSEIKGPALRNILLELNKCPYLDHVYVSLKARTKDEYHNTIKFFRKLKLPHTILWNNSNRMTAILEGLKKEDIQVANLQGKGRDMWLALGVASLESFATTLIDADITTFTDEMPTKLLAPVALPNLDFFFNKAFYTRVGQRDHRMYGRVVRLFVLPFIDSLKRKLGRKSKFLDYLSSFKYPLSGEFSLTSNLALNIRIPGDWGVEVGILTEVFRSSSMKRVCQVDLGFHDHKHRKIGDRQTGLVKMVGEIEKSILRSITEMEGLDISVPFLQSLQVLYRRLGQDYIHSYGNDSLFNSIIYERHEEEKVVDIFSDTIIKAGKEYLKQPFGTLIPSWSRVLSADPNVRHELLEAAQKDLRESGL